MKRSTWLILLATLVVGLPLYWYQSTHLLHFGVDWNIAFYPATMLLLHGQSPYQVLQFHNPFWALLPLIPFALIGLEYGRLALYLFNLFSVAFIAFQLRPKPVAYAALLLSPLLYYYLFLCNIDTLVLWGLFLPPWLGMFFLMTKPQLGIGILAYWTYMLWRRQGTLAALKQLLPLVLVSAASFLVFGNWLVDKSDRLLGGATWNVSFFPWSVPVGLLLLYLAVRKSSAQVSIAAAPFLTPYLSWGTWFFALWGLLQSNLWMVAATFTSWLLYILAQFWFGPAGG